MGSFQKILFKYIKPYTRQLFVILLVIIILISLEALGPWPFKFLIDNVLEDAPIDKQSLTGILVSLFRTKESLGFGVIFLFFAINIFISIFEYVRSIISKRVINALIYNFSQAAFSNLELIAIGFYRDQQVGDYIYRLSYDISALGELFNDGIFPLITSALYVTLTTIILLLINTRLAIFSLIALPFLTIGLYFVNRKIVSTSKKSELSNSAVFSFIQQALTQLKIIQAYSQEKKELSEFNKRVSNSLQTEYKLDQLNFILSLLVGIIIAGSYSFIISYGIKAVFTGELTAGLLIVFIFYLDRLTNPLLSIIYATTVIKESLIRISRIEDFFDKQSHIKDTGKVKQLENGTIEFKNISLYGQDDKCILNNVSFKIPEGKITVIVGVSGSGKTSIISLIPRLINEPSSGQIIIGNHDINDYSVKTLRENIAFVPQEILLFNTTIKDIIAFGKENCTKEEVEKAAKLSLAEEFIKKYSTGYDFKVGEEGNYLSAGQRQRLMLARAYIKNGRIMILDEVFSSQDVNTRLEMLSNLKTISKGKTIIIVSNNLEVISEADYVIVVNNGSVKNQGTHADILKGDLLKHKNYYKLLLGD